MIKKIIFKIFNLFGSTQYFITKEEAKNNASICMKCKSEDIKIYSCGAYHGIIVGDFLISRCNKCNYSWKSGF